MATVASALAGVDRRPARDAHRLALMAALSTVTVVVAVAAYYADGDASADLSPALRWMTSAVAALTWPVAVSLAVISGLHYLAAAVATRAAAGVQLPWGELVASQLAASAANRLTPAGLGGAGVLGRYLTRRGGLAATEAVATVSTLAVVGALADVAAFAVLVGVGAALGLAGAASEVPLLLSRLVSLVPIPSGRTAWLIGGAVLLAVAAAAVLRDRRSAPVARLTAAMRDFGSTVRDLARHPARVAALTAASAGTTLALSAGFATTAVLGPTALPAASFGALMIGFMVASAAANAVPTPGGIGTGDAALVGVLLAAGAPAGASVAAVLAFRLMTFWAPALVGVGLARTLRRRGAL